MKVTIDFDKRISSEDAMLIIKRLIKGETKWQNSFDIEGQGVVEKTRRQRYSDDLIEMVDSFMWDNVDYSEEI